MARLTYMSFNQLNSFTFTLLATWGITEITSNRIADNTIAAMLRISSVRPKFSWMILRRLEHSMHTIMNAATRDAYRMPMLRIISEHGWVTQDPKVRD